MLHTLFRCSYFVVTTLPKILTWIVEAIAQLTHRDVTNVVQLDVEHGTVEIVTENWQQLRKVPLDSHATCTAPQDFQSRR